MNSALQQEVDLHLGNIDMRDNIRARERDIYTQYNTYSLDSSVRFAKVDDIIDLLALQVDNPDASAYESKKKARELELAKSLAVPLGQFVSVMHDHGAMPVSKFQGFIEADRKGGIIRSLMGPKRESHSFPAWKVHYRDANKGEYCRSEGDPITFYLTPDARVGSNYGIWLDEPKSLPIVTRSLAKIAVDHGVTEFSI